MQKIILIGCGKQKRAVRSPARELYTGSLFRARRQYAERSDRRWWIVSAKYGLVNPATCLDPYDVTLDDLSTLDAAAWTLGVVRQLLDELPDDTRLDRLHVELHLGNTYAQGIGYILNAVGIDHIRPLEGLAQGSQLKWYSLRRKTVAT